MPYVASYEGTEKLTLTNPEYWVELRKCLSRSQLKQAEAALSQAVLDMQGNGTVRPDVGMYRDMMVTSSIAAWNLDDANGAVLPVNLGTIGVLAGPDFDRVWARVDQLNKGMEPEDQARFPEAG
jgi:hypothetical protein